jgi:hypothetical protein
MCHNHRVCFDAITGTGHQRKQVGVHTIEQRHELRLLGDRDSRERRVPDTIIYEREFDKRGLRAWPELQTVGTAVVRVFVPLDKPVLLHTINDPPECREVSIRELGELRLSGALVSRHADKDLTLQQQQLERPHTLLEVTGVQMCDVGEQKEKSVQVPSLNAHGIVRFIQTGAPAQFDRGQRLAY